MSNEELVIIIQSGTGTDIKHYLAELWQQMKGLIYKVANKYAAYTELEDLLQESYIAFYRAVITYEHNQNVKFSSYSTIVIQRHLCRYVQQGHMFENNVVSFSTPIAGDEELTLEDTLGNDCNTELEAITGTYNSDLKNIWKIVEELPEQQPTVLKLLYQKQCTLKCAGEHIGADQSKVVTIRNKAFTTLRHCRHTKKLKEYLEYIDLYGNAMQGIGVTRFNKTWTSATERVALKSNL